MIFANAWIRSTRLDGTVVYPRRRAQVDQATVSADPGLVEIMADSSSAMAPLLHKILYDRPGAAYQRGDVVTILSEDGQRGTPPANPFHVLRVQQPGFPLPATECHLARLDILAQTVTWLQRITPAMPDTVRTASFDPSRSQIVASSDGTVGVGLQRVVNGVTYNGYLPGVAVQIGINEYAESTQIQDIGTVDYEHPVVLYDAPLQFAKGDILVLADGRRLVVFDLQHRLQRLTVVLATLQLTEWRRPGDVVYSVPLA